MEFNKELVDDLKARLDKFNSWLKEVSKLGYNIELCVENTEKEGHPLMQLRAKLLVG